MNSTIEITFKVKVKSETHLDENSIKAVINEAQDIITTANFQCIDDCSPESVSVSLSKLKMGGKLIDIGAFGTPELPWNRRLP